MRVVPLESGDNKSNSETIIKHRTRHDRQLSDRALIVLYTDGDHSPTLSFLLCFACEQLLDASNRA